MLPDDERVSYYSKLSDDVKYEFISDVLSCLDYDNLKHYLNEYYRMRDMSNMDATDRREFIIDKIKNRIARKKIISHFWVSFEDRESPRRRKNKKC